MCVVQGGEGFPQGAWPLNWGLKQASWFRSGVTGKPTELWRQLGAGCNGSCLTWSPAVMKRIQSYTADDIGVPPAYHALATKWTGVILDLEYAPIESATTFMPELLSAISNLKSLGLKVGITFMWHHPTYGMQTVSNCPDTSPPTAGKSVYATGPNAVAPNQSWCTFQHGNKPAIVSWLHPIWEVVDLICPMLYTGGHSNASAATAVAKLKSGGSDNTTGPMAPQLTSKNYCKVMWSVANAVSDADYATLSTISPRMLIYNKNN